MLFFRIVKYYFRIPDKLTPRHREVKWEAEMSTVTTHVLDTSLGRPAAGVPVRLEYLGSACSGLSRGLD
jgi:hypothetical protein